MIRRLAVDRETRSRREVGRLFDRLAALGRERGVRRVVVTVHHAAIDSCNVIGFHTAGEAFWDGARRFVPMPLDLTTWSSIRGRRGAVHAIGCLARAGIVHPPVAGVSMPDEPPVATA